MTNVRRSWLALLLCLALVGRLPADEVYLNDGRVIDGEIVSPTAAEIIDIRVASGGLVAIQHFPRAKVQRVVYGISARQTATDELNQQITALSKRPDASAAEWWALARRQQERGETATAKDLAMRVLALDRQHAEARRLLGMARYHGVWMRVNEAAVARGEVFFRGAWVSWAVQEQTLVEESRRHEEQASARKERDEQRRQARIAAAVAAESAAPYQDTYASDFYRSPYYNSYGYGGGYGFSYGGISGGYYPPPVRPVCGPGYGSGYGWHIGAVGSTGNTAWAFHWGGSSNSSTHFP